MLCNRHDFEWHIVGGFLRKILAGLSVEENSNLDIIIVPKTAMEDDVSLETKAQQLLEDAEAIDAIDDVNVAEESYEMGTGFRWNAIARTFYMGQMNMFDLKIHVCHEVNYLRPNEAHHFSCDSITLGSDGLRILAPNNDYDRFSLGHHGLMLLDRLVELHAQETTMTSMYINMPEDQEIRDDNTHLLQRQHKILKEGIYVRKSCLQYMMMSDVECPICLEKERIMVDMECHHGFCMECLAKHLSGPSKRNGECPLCRRPFLFELMD